MAFGSTPTTTTEGIPPTNQIFISSVATPNTANGDLTALEGGPISTDSNGNKTAPASMYVKDGNDVTQGAQADTAATSGTGSWSALALLKGILTKLLGTIAVSGTFWQATQPVSATSLPLPTGAALEAGHLATIDTSTAASKVDLDTIVTNTNKIPASPAQEGGNLATLVTNTTGLATQTTLAGAKTDLDNISTVSGATTDAAVVGDNPGTSSAKLRGLTKIFADVWDGTNHWLQIKVMNGNANGQSTMVNSQSIAIASDQSSVPMKSARTEIAGQAAASVTGTSTDLIPSTDTTGYSFAVLQLTGTWSMTLVAAQCNDNANFLSTQMISAQTLITNTGLLNNITGNGLYIIPLAGRYLRVRPSAWTSNASCVATLELFTTLPPYLVAAIGTYISLAPQTSGGAGTLFHLVSAATTNATNIKASIGQIYGWDISNTSAAWKYVKLHNTAGTPTAGAGVVRTIGVPPNGKDVYHTTLGIPFATGIGLTTVTGAADSDNTAVALNDLTIDIDVR